MYIRQTRTNNKITGEGYFTFRLVRGERIGGRVRQITVLNLGRNFAVKQDDWPVLCSRIDQLLQPQAALLNINCSDHIERAAQRCFEQLVARTPAAEVSAGVASGAAPAASGAASAAPPDFQEVDGPSRQPRKRGRTCPRHRSIHPSPRSRAAERT